MGDDGGKARRRALTYDDRLLIERGLGRGDTISMIARAVGRTPVTVSDEVKRNWTDSPRGMLAAMTRNICAKRADCDRTGLCGGRCARPCWKCRDWKCNALCPDFEAEPCPRLSRAPFCCNACDMRIGSGCSHPYRFYEAKYADDLAKRRKSASRAGIDMDPASFEASMAEVAAGLKLGQSPAHICAANPKVGVSKSTLYRWAGGESVEALTRLDLPRAVRYKPRKAGGGPASEQIPRAFVRGRTHDRFMELPECERENAVEMDTVVGRSGLDRQCVLTIYFRRLHVQLFMLLADKTAECVVAALDDIEALIGEKAFRRLFKTVLCDRGTEFADVIGMEGGTGGAKRMRVYFTDPQQSQQKGAAEKNHVELRRILPKRRTDFDKLTCADMARCMSHVNSYCRASIDWCAPIDLAMAVLPRELIEGLGIEKVEPSKVNLTPDLVPHAQAR